MQPQEYGGTNISSGQQQDFGDQNFENGKQQYFGGQNFGGQQQNFNSYRSDQDYANYRSPDDFEDQTQYYDRHQQYEAAGSSDPDDEYRTGNKHSKHFDEDEDDDVDLVSKIRSLFNRK